MLKNKDLYQRLTQVFSHFDDCAELLNQVSGTAYRGIRVNTLKCSTEKFKKYNISSKPTPFCNEGFYIESDFSAGNHPLHHAGAYYVQEPSATSAVELLDVTPGDIVLDMCAAPGGKSTQIAQKLGGSGVVISNELFFKRAKIIVSNFERLGVPNGIVISANPQVISEKFVGVFDKVLVDAPCSGEGMLRKDETIEKEWTSQNVTACSIRQLKILDSAAKVVKTGGILVYSTCTYSKEENEDVVEQFLKEHKEFEPVEVNLPFGRRAININNGIRILTTDGGEGHFVAKFKKVKAQESSDIYNATNNIKKAEQEVLQKFLCENKITLFDGNLLDNRGKIYLTPKVSVPDGITILRNGILLGEIRKGRFVPEHSLFMCPFIKCENCLDLTLDDNRVEKFLHGVEIECGKLKGFIRLNLDGIPLGFGKASGGMLKNYYPKGLRKMV